MNISAGPRVVAYYRVSTDKQGRSGQRTAEVLPYLNAARRAGATTLQQLADALTARGVHTPRGGERWRPWQVRRVLDRRADWIPQQGP